MVDFLNLLAKPVSEVARLASRLSRRLMASKLAEPMRADCADLTEVVVKSGHWMAQEKPVDVNAGLARWLALKFPNLWPK